jgi:hypothetical protein
MPTYTPLQSIQLTEATSIVTFSGISQVYQDLVLVSKLNGTSSGQAIRMRINGDSSSNYSYTAMRGSGSAASSERATSQTYVRIGVAIGTDSTNDCTIITNFQNYSNTTTFKTLVGRANNVASGQGAEANVGLWRSTSAITSFEISATSGNLTAGSTFDLYGISSVANCTSSRWNRYLL